MVPGLEAMNQTVTAEMLAGAEQGDSAVTVSGICFVIMPEEASARGGNCTAGRAGRSPPRACGRSRLNRVPHRQQVPVLLQSSGGAPALNGRDTGPFISAFVNSELACLP